MKVRCIERINHFWLDRIYEIGTILSLYEGKVPWKVPTGMIMVRKDMESRPFEIPFKEVEFIYGK